MTTSDVESGLEEQGATDADSMNSPDQGAHHDDRPNSDRGLNNGWEKSVEHWAQRLRPLWAKSAQDNLEIAATVAKAKNALDGTSFRKLAEHLGTSKSTLVKFATIHSRVDRFEAHEESLPLTWTVLYKLSTLKDRDFDDLVAAGVLRPALSEKDVKEFVAGRNRPTEQKSLSDQVAYVSARISFPATFTPQREDDITRKIIAAVGEQADVTISFSKRKLVTARK